MKDGQSQKTSNQNDLKKRYTHIQKHLWKQVYKEKPLFGYAIFYWRTSKGATYQYQTGAFLYGKVVIYNAQITTQQVIFLFYSIIQFSCFQIDNIFQLLRSQGSHRTQRPSALMSLACCNSLAAPSSPRLCIARSERAQSITSSISAMFCSATDTSCFVSSSCLGVPSALIQD